MTGKVVYVVREGCPGRPRKFWTDWTTAIEWVSAHGLSAQDLIATPVVASLGMML